MIANKAECTLYTGSMDVVGGTLAVYGGHLTVAAAGCSEEDCGTGAAAASAVVVVALKASAFTLAVVALNASVFTVVVALEASALTLVVVALKASALALVVAAAVSAITGCGGTWAAVVCSTGATGTASVASWIAAEVPTAVDAPP